MIAALADAEMSTEGVAPRSFGFPASAPEAGERAVALTDAILAIESAAFAIRLARDRRTADSPLRSPFLAFFGATAVASVAGAVLHGLTTDRSDPGRRALWRLSLSSIGVAALSSWSLAARLAGPPGLRRRLDRTAAVVHIPYFVLVAGSDQAYRTAVVWYLPAAVALGGALASRLGDADDRGPAAVALTGLGVTFAAAAVQTRRIGLGPRFDHNALYHTLQAVGVGLFDLAARGFVRGRPTRSELQRPRASAPGRRHDPARSS